jgi:hypothetical protein
MQNWKKGAGHLNFEIGPWDLPLHDSLQLKGFSNESLPTHVLNRPRPIRWGPAGCWQARDNTIWEVKSSDQPVTVRFPVTTSSHNIITDTDNKKHCW